MNKLMWAASSAVIAAVCGSAGAAWAQEAEPGLVSELVVTAQKREQNLQDVPIVVTTLPARQLQDAGVRDIKDLQVLTPGLNVTSSTSAAQTSARIRGVGTIGDNPGLESSVGTVIDGVYRARSSVAYGDLGELERIEVLKGPQGTLFGKNTSAGVINITTKEPDFTFGARGELTASNFDGWGVAASVTGPILGDSVAGRLYAAKRKRDGFGEVRKGAGPGTVNEDSNEDYWTVRGQLLWEAREGFKVKFLADYTDRDENCCVNYATIPGPTAAIIDALAADAGITRPADPFGRVTYANRDMVSRIKDGGLSVQADLALTDAIDLTSITAWRRWKSAGGSDIDFSSADIWHRPTDGSNYTKIEQVSQELRLAGSTEKLNWIAGLFYQRELLDMVAFTNLGAAYEPYFGLLLSQGTNPQFVSVLTGRPFGTNFPAGQGPRDSFDHESKSWALFGNANYQLTEQLELTLGVRYTDDQKEVTAHYTNSVPAAACAAARARGLPAAAVGAICAPHTDSAFDNVVTEQDRGEKRWSGTVKLAYRFDPRLMVYGSYAEGFKSGGFNLDRARMGPGVMNPDTSFPAETVASWEVGVKSNTADANLLLNATVFHQTFEDFQLNTYTGISFLVASIPEVVSRGVDLDFAWRTPLDGLSLSGGVTYAETQFGDFTPPAGISARLPNTRISYAPLWSAAATTSYERSLDNELKFRASLSAKYTSEYNTGSNLDPLKSQKELVLLNGRLVLGAEDDRWSVELWAQNLTDEDYYQVIVDQPLQTGTFAGFLGAPRTYGLTLRTQF